MDPKKKKNEREKTPDKPRWPLWLDYCVIVAENAVAVCVTAEQPGEYWVAMLIIIGYALISMAPKKTRALAIVAHIVVVAVSFGVLVHYGKIGSCITAGILFIVLVIKACYLFPNLFENDESVNGFPSFRPKSKSRENSKQLNTYGFM